MTYPTREQAALADALAIHFDSVGVRMLPTGDAEFTMSSDRRGERGGYSNPAVVKTALVDSAGNFVGGFALPREVLA